jgi:pimeloyl-ACP methyl ester carboxylesterase
MPLRFNCTAVAAAILVFSAASATAQQAPSPAPGDAVFNIFLRGTQIGREQVNVATAPSGWIITSSGASQAPLDFTIARFEVKYSSDWQPLELTLDARLRNATALVKTSFSLTTAINEVTQNSRTASKEDQTSARTIVIPNNVFGAYEALAARLWTVAADAELPVYVVPQGEVKMKVRSVTDQSLTGPAGALQTRRFDVTFQNPDRPVNAVITVDGRLRLVRFELQDVGLLVVREDASSVAMRPETVRNPTDADFSVPANGFNLAATLTMPPTVAGRLRHPAVILVGGARPGDRDLTISGVPVFAQLARALADAGTIAVRYDRRGSGQSGGRTETAALSDYADDILAVVRAVAKKDGVDKERIVVAGYGDGAAAALLAASRSKDIDALVTIDAAGTKGADMILEQQQRLLAGLNLSAEERQARIDLQKKIQAAVAGGGSWEGVPDAMRRQADTPWFRSVLQFDPAQVVPKVKQPMLIVHAELDNNIPPTEADRLAELANARKKAGPVQTARIPGVTQALTEPNARSISAKIGSTIAEWVKKL